MMAIENKIGLYIRLTKVGSTSLVTKHKINESFQKKVWINKRDGNLRDSTLKIALRTKFELGSKIWYNLFKFATIRNPYDRMVSSWKYLVVNENYLDNLKNSSHFRNLDFKSFVKKISKTDIEYPFNNECFFENGNTINFWWHLSPQYQQLSDANGNLLMDFLIRFENYQSDFEKVCEKLKIKKYNLLHEKKTRYKHYTEYYDEETKSIIEEKYANDIKYFGYEFGK